MDPTNKKHGVGPQTFTDSEILPKMSAMPRPCAVENPLSREGTSSVLGAEGAAEVIMFQ